MDTPVIFTFADATALVLRTLQAELGASAIWVGHLDAERSVLRVVDAAGEASFGLEPGVEAPIESSFCQVLASGVGGAVSNDVPRDPAYGGLPAALLLAVGSFAGAPLRMSDGSAVGTLCAFHHAPGAYSARELRLMRTFAALLARQLEHDLERADMERVVEHLRLQASTDSLTGLANRRSFRARLDETHSSGEAATLALLDVDGLKAINDRHGHLAGDAVLRAVAEALSSAGEPGDLVARLGGDEFAALLRTEDISAWWAEVRQGMRRRGDALGYDVAASMGHVALRHFASAEAALSRADIRLYDAKRDHAAHSTRS